MSWFRLFWVGTTLAWSLSAIAQVEPWGYVVELRSLKIHPLLESEASVGRLETSTVALNSDTVSRRHAIIEHSDTAVILRDVGSTNGTRVNGHLLYRPQTLRAGDIIQFADDPLLFHTDLSSLAEDELRLRLVDRFVRLAVPIPEDIVDEQTGQRSPATTLVTINPDTGEFETRYPDASDRRGRFTQFQSAFVGHVAIVDGGLELSLWALPGGPSLRSRRQALEQLKHATLRIELAAGTPDYSTSETPMLPFPVGSLLPIVQTFPHQERELGLGEQFSHGLARQANPLAMRDAASSVSIRRRLSPEPNSKAADVDTQLQNIDEALDKLAGTSEDELREQLKQARDLLAATNGAPPVVAGDTTNARNTAAGARFRVAVNTVSLPVTVTDDRQRLLSGLSAEDFRVFENGEPQTLDFFSDGEAKLKLVVLLDTSASMRQKIGMARKAAIQFAHSLKPGDEIRVVEFNDRVLTLSDFTSDVNEVTAAIEQTEVKGATSLYTAIYASLRDLGSLSQADNERRGVIVLSDGADTRSLVSFDDVREAARKTNAMVYAISLRASKDDLKKEKYFKAKYELDLLSRESGGRSYAPQKLDDLVGVYEAIASELKSQYLLGYVSTNDRTDGAWRQLEVMADEPNAKVRTRAGYYAPKPARRKRRR